MSIYVKPPEGTLESPLQQIYIQASGHPYPLDALYTLQNGKVCNLFEPEPALSAGNTFLYGPERASNQEIFNTLENYAMHKAVTTTINTVHTKHLLINHEYEINETEKKQLKDFVERRGGHVYLFCTEWISKLKTTFNLDITNKDAANKATRTTNSTSTVPELSKPANTTYYAYSITQDNKSLYQDSANTPVIASIPIGNGCLIIIGCNWRFSAATGTSNPEGLIRRDWETVLIGMLND